MNPVPSQSEVVTFMAAYPAVVLQAISLYYPLSTEWMRKYGDILCWGDRTNVDISDCASKSFYTVGIIFNHSIDWTDDVRSIVAANLAYQGEDFVLHGWGSTWEDYVKKRPATATVSEPSGHGGGLLQQAWMIIDFVATCPKTVKTLARADASALLQHARAYCEEPRPPANLSRSELNAWREEFPPLTAEDEERIEKEYFEAAMERYMPSITTLISWDELTSLFVEDRIPSLIANPALWNQTLVHVFTESVTKQLLTLFYWQHLNGALAPRQYPWANY